MNLCKNSKELTDAQKTHLVYFVEGNALNIIYKGVYVATIQAINKKLSRQ